MRPTEEIAATAIERWPFSNATEGDMWTSRWCDTCIHDKPAREGEFENGCPILAVSLLSVTPMEWKETGPSASDSTYTCIEYKNDSDEGS